MTGYPYTLAGPIAPKALGLIVLQVDETIEQDFRRLFLPTTALYVSRVPSGDVLTPDTIGEMERHLPPAAELLPPAARFDSLGYACTSGTALIGAGRVAELLSARAPTSQITNPLTATFAALSALGARRVGIVSPYVPSVADPIRAAFTAHGFEVPAVLSFGEEVEARVARIDPASTRAAAIELAGQAQLDAIFLSCTNLRTLEILHDLEATLGLPVVSSNQALAWHMARLAAAEIDKTAPGRLFRLG